MTYIIILNIHSIQHSRMHPRWKVTFTGIGLALQQRFGTRIVINNYSHHPKNGCQIVFHFFLDNKEIHCKIYRLSNGNYFREVEANKADQLSRALSDIGKWKGMLLKTIPMVDNFVLPVTICSDNRSPRIKKFGFILLEAMYDQFTEAKRRRKACLEQAQPITATHLREWQTELAKDSRLANFDMDLDGINVELIYDANTPTLLVFDVMLAKDQMPSSGQLNTLDNNGGSSSEPRLSRALF